jgi:hypothetical protein
MRQRLSWSTRASRQFTWPDESERLPAGIARGSDGPLQYRCRRSRRNLQKADAIADVGAPARSRIHEFYERPVVDDVAFRPECAGIDDLADGFVREAGDVAAALPDFEQDFAAARLERDVIIGQHVARRNERAGAPVLGGDDDAVGFRDWIHHADCVELRKFASRRSITTRGSAVGGVCARHAALAASHAPSAGSKPPRAIAAADFRVRCGRTLPFIRR